MTFIQAVYGSQYYEITLKGKDGNKGRLNGNIFLSAFVVLILLTITGLALALSPHAAGSFENMATRIAGYDKGKAAGKMLAIPVMGLCYLVIANTAGSQKNFTKTVEQFNLLPVEQKNKANKKVLVPFFIVLAIFVVVVMSAPS